MQQTNPYLEARKEWNSRFGELEQGRKFWRRACILCLLTLFVLAAGFVLLSLRTKTVPYVIEVEKTGFARAIGPAYESPASEDAIVRYHVGAFIRNARTVTYDGAAMKAFLDAGYAYARGAAVNFLNDHYQKHDPFETAKSGSVTPELVSLLQISEKSYQVRWREVCRSLEGTQTSEKQFEALITVELEPPTTEAQVLKNPLGVYIVELSWTQQL